MALSEEQRFPLMTGEDRRLLQWLHEHPSAPRFNHHCGDRLNTAGLQRVHQFEARVKATPPDWQPGGEAPAWLADYTAFCLRDVPFYRRYPPQGIGPGDFHHLPTTSRADLARAPWAFVPDSQALDDLIIYNTSGTTGHPLAILSHPDVASMYLPLLRAALATRNIVLEGGPARVSIILACFQKRTFTYASISSFLGHAGYVKVNLNPDDWRAPDDRATYLDDCKPEIYTGDPISFAELASLPLRSQPKALISTAMALLPGQQRRLEDHFGCPVLDLYSMNEAGPIAVRIAGEQSASTSTGNSMYVLLQPQLYVQVLDPQGRPCPPGVRGEITLSGGFNPFLPLLRYRTGDYASTVFLVAAKRFALADMEGRPPTVFRSMDGRRINNIDISAVLKPFALSQFTLHQAADGCLTLRVQSVAANPDAERLRRALLSLFGDGQELSIEDMETSRDKVIQYTSDYTD